MNDQERQNQVPSPLKGVTRRELLGQGAKAAVAVSLLGRPARSHADDRSLQSAERKARNVDSAVILLWMEGGASHLDTFDPKPRALPEIRGPFRAIETSVHGVMLCEHLPLLARQMDRLAVLRGVTHGEGSHERAKHYVQSGSPLRAGSSAPGLAERIACSAKLRTILAHSAAPDCGQADEAGIFVRSCREAVRAVEAGARFVTVTMNGWDTHFDNFTTLQNRLLPDLDSGFSTLLDDLTARDLLERTLVVWMSEFGRTPRINAGLGRDHWPDAMSVVLAGGGIRGGQVIGETDAEGGQSPGAPIRIEELHSALHIAAGMFPKSSEILPLESMPSCTNSRKSAQSALLQKLFD